MGSNFPVEEMKKVLRQDIDACHHWKDYVALFCTVGGGLGYLPKAPGTWGSLPGLVLGALVFEGGLFWSGTTKIFYYVIVYSILTLWAYWAIDRVERLLNIHDDGRFVVDEVVGQAIACSLIEPTILSLGVAFILFRVLDILKPGPVGYLDRMIPGAWGTLLDDLLAGLVAGLLVFFAFFT
jgi:phosphatidylglycerophosphatase A